MSGNKKFSVNKDDLWLGLLGVFIAPAPVIARKGFFSRDTLLSVILFLVFFFPAIIHAFYVIYETSKERELENRSDSEDAVPLTNGDFNVDLESNANDALPEYNEVVDSSKIADISDNKIQK
ncbi:hypothetical protein KAFR_0F01870 [Kazachstania africana CBS 2517]|uniref:Uncharacterized protein n=1 Tax=Kazachstania africana (strain ATCC 22294 / BCRC 22015 / CBS 2517 / CECT 1963 / NBRC 1671 / NRRL Y-8276) TaxID=1071382 RepID=H2AWN4_KAZAF|nr:hypothetical protein KAFR_0F01870 [Kazachstania africana CBS 2517]CCF58784.1 hypothetical protein KAFR_0F01870 [Kazachstania africana CBS 2517]